MLQNDSSMMHNNECFDVTIIGGGPAGLFASFYSGLREMKTKIIEYQPFLGGKVHVYPEKMIWDVGGLTPLPGEQLIKQMVEQGLTFNPEVVLGEKVTSIAKAGDHFVLHTESGASHESKTVILAVGGGILKPMKLDIEGAERFEITNLHYTVKSLARFQGKTVLISGGGNTAVDWANELEPIAEQVLLTYRKDVLKGHEAEISKLEQSSVKCLYNTSIEKLIAGEEQDRIASVRLLDETDGTSRTLQVDEVIINHGYERERELLHGSELQINLIEDFWVDGTPRSESSIPGIYAAGDILKHEGKLHLIAGAFQDAANAVNRAKQYMEPEALHQARVSSHNDKFNQKNRELLKHLYKR